MKYSSSILLASASWASAALIQQCSTGDGLPVKADLTKDLNNRYCGAVNQILYENVSRSGSFKAVTGMSSNGECRKEDKAYGGPMAPFDAGVSPSYRNEPSDQFMHQLTSTAIPSLSGTTSSQTNCRL